MSVRADELETVRSWGLPGPAIASLDDVLQRAGFQGAGTRVDASFEAEQHSPELLTEDEYLLRLVMLAKRDQLAARVVLQRLLPALCAFARRTAGTSHHRRELLDDLIANSWTVIRNYPVDRRPRRVAANLVRDIGFQTTVRPQRRLSATAEVPTAPHNIDEPIDEIVVEPLHELVRLLKTARDEGSVSDEDVEFICQLVNHRRPENLAAVLEVTPRTVRNHRDAIVHRLRNAALVAA